MVKHSLTVKLLCFILEIEGIKTDKTASADDLMNLKKALEHERLKKIQVCKRH